MKTKSVFPLVCSLFAGTLLFAAGSDDSARQLQIYPKNLARQNVGTNLLVFNATSQTYVPTEAAAAWLDDDVATGWPPTAGHSYYLLSLAEAQLVTNFAISARAGAGTVNLFVADSPAPPVSKAWTLIARDLSLDTINSKKLATPFSRFTKYVLIETNIADPGPWYSIYLYGEKPAVAYTIKSRVQPVDTRSLFGPYVNNETAFNLSSLYARASVTYANNDSGPADWQKAIDDNPESAVTVGATQNDAGMALKFGSAVGIQRLSVMTATPVKGRLDFFLIGSQASPEAPAASAQSAKSDYIKAAYAEKSTGADSAAAVTTSLAGLTPTASIVLDGDNNRGSIDFPAVIASKMLVRWTPDTAGEKIGIAEINSFGDLGLADHELATAPDTIAQGTGSDASKDTSKDLADSKDMGKEPVPPVGEYLPTKTPFVPYTLGGSPILTNRLTVVEGPVSP